MIKKTITYAGFDGNDITEDFHFHLSTAELTEKELSYPGGYAEFLNGIVQNDDRPAIIAAFKDLILSTVGHKSPDGKGFVKKGVAEEFVTTEAFSQLFMELLTDTAKCVEFFNGVMPKELADKVSAAMARNEIDNKAAEVTKVPDISAFPVLSPSRPKKFPEDYTREELETMTRAEFDELLQTIPGNNIPRHLLIMAMRKQH